MNRRNLLSLMISTAAGTALAPAMSLANSATTTGATTPPKTARRAIAWRNWSGSEECFPQARKAPGSVAELQELITTAKGCVRPVGAGHSFMPLVPTDDTIVSLSRLSGVVSHDAASHQAVIRAGTRLADIGRPLGELGQAMINMPDIDEQSLAGALGTATHGTGTTLGCLPDFVEGLQLVTAKGEVIDCDRQNNSDIFAAARVNLGALGVLTEVRMQNMPKYTLKRETTWHPIEEILENAESLANNNRNYEFIYIPFSGMGFNDIHNLTDEAPSTTGKIDSNDGSETLRQVRDWLSWSPKIRELALSSVAKGIEKEVVVANSWENYASERNVRFNEMEYHLPREHGLKAFREVRATVEKYFPEIFFPFEFRYVKSDDIWLSPFYGRDCCSIAVHRYFSEDHKPMFKAVEAIFRKYHGRPHWGKINTMNRKDLAVNYERWNDFSAVRRELDPEGKFLNTYLKTLFDTA